ncbi:MAG TPA: phosphate acyltransferase, partial [Sphingobium sp.]|nr:phosphate acyltransferase [Sphingobium sp.]
VANAVHVAARLLEEDIPRRIAADMAGVEGLGAVASKLEQPVK